MPGRAEAPAALLRGVDRAAFAVSLALKLQRAGISLGFTSITAFSRGMEAVRPDSRSALYWVARTTLVGRHCDLAVFDAVFEAVFADAVFSLDPHARRLPAGYPAGEDDAYSPLSASQGSDDEDEGLPWVTLPAVRSGAEDACESGMMVPERMPSELEAVADTPFEELDPDDLALLDAWLATALGQWPSRRSRRLAPHHAGRQVALRPTLARARRTGYEPVELVRHRPVYRRRRVVMLGDVSQSMQPHASAYFHLMRAAVLATDAEVFAFSTSLTRLTPVLAHKSAWVAVEQASETVGDRFGGTRIATNIRALLASRHGGCVRGAVVIVASDGWDSDPPGDLAAAMARLARLAYRIIWINPRSAAPDYEPLVGSMAAALPYCDDFLSAHNIRSMSEVVDAITGSNRFRVNSRG